MTTPRKPAVMMAGMSSAKGGTLGALGAAYLAGVGNGLWTLEHVRSSWRERRRYEPAMSDDERRALLTGWHRAVERSLGWDEA